jgi:hypothetical protein
MAVPLRSDSEALDRRMPTHILSRSSECGGSRRASCQLSRSRRFQRLGTYGHNPCPGLHRSDFLVLHGKERLHVGVIIVVPSVTPVSQRELFSAALAHIGARDLIQELTSNVLSTPYQKQANDMRKEAVGEH